MKSYAVIGLGRFGTEVAVRLYESGEEVLAVDTDETLVDQIGDRVTRAVAADGRDRNILERLGLGNFDCAVVAVGSDLASAAMITMNLKLLKVPKIICKAHDDTYREILERLGADRVIIPEREMADKLCTVLTSSRIMEYIELSKEIGMVEMQTPAKWKGKTIRNLELRSRFGLNIIAVRQGDQIRIPPDLDRPMEEEDVLVLLGRYDAVNQIRS